MVRSEKLPPNVSSFVDRHGKRRYRWRRAGRSAYFVAHPNSAEGKDELEVILSGGKLTAERHAPGTVEWLAGRYFASPAFAGNSTDRTRHVSRLILDKFIAEYGTQRVANFRFDHIETILMRAAEPRVSDKGRKMGGPHAAINLRDRLKPMFDYAVRLKLIATNPVADAQAPKAPKGGFHPWTEGEIAQYRSKHAVGTKARLALEIFLWTAQRRGDGSTFGRRHMIDGRIEYTQDKTGKTLWLPAAPQLLEAIAAMPVTGTGVYLVTDYGKPYSKDGLGNKMRQWCDEAGLPQCTAHGLRKAAARRVAETGGTNAQIKAVGGWSNDKEVAIYTAGADQAQLAEQAMAPVIAFDLANRKT